jgi:hypothetical protein
MRVARVKVSAGKPGEFNADGAGYAPSGESSYSRRVAHCGPNLKATTRDAAPLPPLLVSEKIRTTQIAIGTLEAKLSMCTDPKTRARLEKDLRIKNEILRRLGHQINGTSRIWGRIAV